MTTTLVVVLPAHGSAALARKFTFPTNELGSGFVLPYQNQTGGLGFALTATEDLNPGTSAVLVRLDETGAEVGSVELLADDSSSDVFVTARPDQTGQFFAGYVHDTGYADFGLFNLGDRSTVFTRRLPLTAEPDRTSVQLFPGNVIGVLQDGGTALTATLFNGTTGALIFERTYTSDAFLAAAGFLSGQFFQLSARPGGAGYLMVVPSYEIDLNGTEVAYNNSVVVAYLDATGAVTSTYRLQFVSGGPAIGIPALLEDDSVVFSFADSTVDAGTQEVVFATLLVSLEPDGDVRWGKKYTGASLSLLTDSASNGSFYLSGSRDTSSGQGLTSDGVILRVSATDGSIQNQANLDVGESDFLSISGLGPNAIYATSSSPVGASQVMRTSLLKLPTDLSAVSTAVEYDRDVTIGFLVHVPGDEELLLSTMETNRDVGAISLTENFGATLGCTLFTPIVVAVTNPGITIADTTIAPVAVVVNSASSVPVTGAGSFTLGPAVYTSADICGGTVGAPVISSTLTANGTVGAAFNYTIAATNSPTSYNATGLPAGLAINTANGAITGTPTTAAVTNVTISATNAGGTGDATLVITVVAAPPAAPVINSTLTANGTVGAAFNYTIAATNSPTSYNATGLPAGLAINTANGAITGTPTTAAVTNVTISATNAGGTGDATLVITVVAAPPAAPVINSTLTANGTVGAAFNYTIAATNSPTSYNATGLPAGLAINTANGAITGTPTAAAVTNVTISATNAGGTGNATLVITVVSATAPPPPALPTGAPTAYDSFTAQWTAVAGATGYRLDVATDAAFTTFLNGYQDLDVGNVTSRLITGVRLGTYYVRVRATSAGGTSGSSSTFSLDVGSRLLNLSTRGQASTADPMIVGFYVTGAPKTLLIRVASSALAVLGVPGTLPNPRLRLVSNGVDVAVNDDWDASDPAVIAAVTASGAGLLFAPGSPDSVIVAANLAAGGYTAIVESVTGEPGVVLVELYEIDQVGRLINISTRGFTVTAGSDVMIPGTYIGPTSKRLLIRVVGETLQQYVPNSLVDPILEIYDGDAAQNSPPILTNDDWDVNDAALAATWTAGNPQQVAGLPFANGSKDAAVLVVLPKNNNGYTALAKGKGGTSGTVLVEIYEVP